MSIEICTSHFNEDLEWLKKSPWPVSIVHHEGGAPVDYTYIIPNVGFEVTSYLKYIIERYDSLPDYVAFIHGHETAFHQLGDRLMLDMIRTANVQKYDYVPLNNCWRCIYSPAQLGEKLEFAKNHFFPVIEENFITCVGAQFIVSKKAILLNKKELYQHWYSVTESKDTAILFELCWHSIFGCGPSVVPYVDHFIPKLSEVLYSSASIIAMTFSHFKPCFIGNSPLKGFIHVTNQAEYDYYSERGGTFFVEEHPNVDFTIDKNKLIFLPYIGNILNCVSTFENIANKLVTEDRILHT